MIATQYIKLNMVPSGYPPVVYLSQYDVGRPVGFVVSASGSVVNLDIYTVTLEATRTDGTAITVPVTTDGNIAAFATTATMTNKKDRYPAQLVVTDGNGKRIASIPVTMMVVKAAMDENAEGVEEDRSLYQQYTGTVQSLIADIREDIVDINTHISDMQFNTCLEMKASTTLKSGMICQTAGYYSINDGGAALYRIYDTIPATYYETLQNGLYGELITDGTIVPEAMGAYGDGVRDDTQVFTSAVNTGMMVVCEKKYKITQKIQLKKGITGHGEIIFSGNGCFTVSMGTTVTGITVRTSGKLLDVIDTDIGSASVPNVHANVLFKDIDVVCESGASTLFDLKATAYGFFDMVFKGVDVAGQCDKAVNIIATNPGWITQIMFIDCMFGKPLHVCTLTKADRIHFERCTSQADDNNKNNLLYDVNNCRMFTIMNCFDWDFPYDSTAKLYKFTDCRECVWIGNNRTIFNFDNTISELMQFFAVLMIGEGYSPLIYNKANVLNSTLEGNNEIFFQNPTGYGTTLVPIRTSKGNGFRCVNSYSLPYGAYSYEFAVDGEGKISIRVRVVDQDSPLDADGNHTTKWGNWKTFTPDA